MNNQDKRDAEDFYYNEWLDEKNGSKPQYAQGCKEQFMRLNIERTLQPYHWYKKELVHYEMLVILN